MRVIPDRVGVRASTVGRDAIGSSAIKICALPVTAVSSIASMHFLSAGYGTDALALYGLVLSIPLLLPFTDLGLGGAVAEIVASRAQSDPRGVLAIVSRVFKRLAVVAVILIIFGWIASATGVWTTILSIDSPATNLAAGTAMTFLCLGIPTGVGYRILLGFQKNRSVVAFQSAAALSGSLAVLALSVLGAPLWCVIPAPQVATLLLAVAAFKVAIVRLTREAANSASKLAHARIHSQIWTLALANLAIGISLPFIYQSGRILTAHLSTTTQVAIVVAASQLFSPLVSVLQAGGQSLWPYFSQRRPTGNSSAPLRLIVIAQAMFIAAGLLAGAALITLGPIVTRFSTAGHAIPDDWTLVAYAAAIVAVAANLPVGMAMMGPRAITVQAISLGATAAVTLTLTALLVSDFGAAGVPAALAVSLTLVGTLPNMLWLFLVGNRKPNLANTPPTAFRISRAGDPQNGRA